MNRIPDEERKSRRKRPVESKNAKNFYVENLLRKKQDFPHLKKSKNFQNFPIFDNQSLSMLPCPDIVNPLLPLVPIVPCVNRNVLLECSILQNFITSDIISPFLRNR